MDSKLTLAILSISLALVFYTIGVWSEHKAKTIKIWHLAAFWTGLAFDTIGTLTMSYIAQDGSRNLDTYGSLIHGVTGLLAIVLMVIHAIWATMVFWGKNNERKITFHKFSVFVWVIWLIPYFVGMIMGMM